MMNEEYTATVQEHTQAPNMPQTSNVPSGDINQGTVLIESQRAIAEAQGKLVIAQRFPRDPVRAYSEVMKACQRPSLAKTAFYNYGIKELSQDDGKSEMQAYAWDLETNTISTQNFTNPHIRETKSGAVKLTSQRDIYELNANMGARRLRSRILAILPADLVEDAVNECKRTIAGKSDEPLIDRVKKMVVQFAKYGVTQEQIEKRLGRKIDTMNTDDFVEYIGIFNSLKDGASKVSEWFESAPESNELTAALEAAMKAEQK